MRTSERLDDVSTADDMAPLLKKRRIDEQELAREESMEEQLEEDPAEEMANQQEQHRRQEWLKLSKKKRTALRRLHNMTGHSSHASMTRMLKASVADQDVISAVKHFKCQVCQETAKEQEPAVTNRHGHPFTQRFNYEVAADVFEIHDAPEPEAQHFELDVATKFHVAGRVAGGGVPSSKSVLTSSTALGSPGLRSGLLHCGSGGAQPWKGGSSAHNPWHHHKVHCSTSVAFWLKPLAQVFGSSPSNRWGGGSRISLKEKRLPR